MSNLPLPGRIYFRENGEANSYSLIDHDAIKWVMALLVNGEHTASRQTKILERMAACWNACQGIETEELEIIADADETFSTVRDRLIAQRDELLVTLQRRSGVIRILEQDVHAHQQRANNAIGTRKVLWDLLGECLPLLEYDAQETHCGPSHDAIVALIQRINDARTAVQAEELSDRSDHHGADWTDREQEYLK